MIYRKNETENIIFAYYTSRIQWRNIFENSIDNTKKKMNTNMMKTRAPDSELRVKPNGDTKWSK